MSTNIKGDSLKYDFSSFLANVNSRSCSLYVIVRPSVCLSSVVCRLSSVCNVRTALFH